MISSTFPSQTSNPTTSKNLNENHTETFIIIFGSIAGILVVSIFVGSIFCWKRRQLLNNIEKLQTTHGKKSSKRILPRSNSTLYDEWEISWDQLVIRSEDIGSGAYGQILQGKYMDGSEINKNRVEVAIKMPQKFASESTIANFMREICLMKQLTGNPNMVQMLGCITKGNRICLVLEYCLHLDLLTYVQNLKNQQKTSTEIQIKTKKQFFIFAWQISHGLASAFWIIENLHNLKNLQEFLASKNIIHRDLAARNILIDGEKNAKISDFGLSIIVENQTPINLISLLERRKLPIKWLAFESLKNYEFSFQTDIWSFGILLFEMYSFGEIPFENVNPGDLLNHLERGERPLKPEFCSNEMFLIMSNCWSEIPSVRPSPKNLIEEFTKFLEEATEGYGYLDLLETSANSNKLKMQFSSFESIS